MNATPNDSKPAEQWQLVREIYEQARDLEPAAREAHLAALGASGLSGLSGVSQRVITEVRSLLAHAAVGGIDDTADPLFAAPEMPGAAEMALDAERNTGLARIGERLGNWQIVSHLGSGGMGDVFEARRADGHYEGLAAVKLLKRGMDSARVLRRFAQEQQTLARLNHPHIARLFDAGQSADGLPYFVMEKVEGEPIDVAARGLTMERRLALFLQLADAVAHAHRNLLVHRDLKPGNVLVTPEGVVKLLDFGIAKALDPAEASAGLANDATLNGPAPFTPNYASPEQVRGEPVSTATDIYSLGVLLYQLMTGVRPTGRAATTPQEAARSVLEESPTRPSSVAPSWVIDPQWKPTRAERLKGDIDNILMKSLEKPVERRYASVEAFAADVRAFLGGFPVQAHAPSAAYLTRKWIARNRATFAVATLGTVGVLAGLVASLWQGREAATARDEARRQLASVKHVTNELVFRYGDAISMLPGGAASQEAMLQETVRALDVTLANNPGDPDLTALVVASLGRLAQLQGNHTFATPERAAEAEATVTRALALADSVWTQKRGEWRFANQHLITLLTRAQLLRLQNKPAEGLAVLEVAGRRAAEALAETLPDEGRANLLDLRANLWVTTAQFNDHVGRPSLGRPQEALRFYQKAEDDFKALYGNATLVAAMNKVTTPGEPTSKEFASHNLGNVFAGRALVRQRLDDDEAMRRDCEQAIAHHRLNVERSPKSVPWRQTLMFDHNSLALALLRLNDGGAALKAAQRAWDLAGDLLASEGAQAPAGQMQPTLAPQFAQALAAVGRDAQALAIYDLALKRLEQMRLKSATPATVLREAVLRVAKASSLAAVGQSAAANGLVQQALADLETLKTEPQLARDLRLARAEAQVFTSQWAPAEQRPAATASARAHFDEAARERPLSLRHQAMLAQLR